ncbi:TetR/AcrR family transcriptional regulator [Aeromicrobium sp.]|uniref:TetR/AcrR family transcriptional regulator n=1 Tax=Aeromicrobium sp. TaxID=1871063 RepID=UPI0030BE7FB8
MARSERTYAGSTLEVRREQRRAALVEATLDLVGEGGSSAVSVRSVCRAAGLTDRYFYESFASRDELLVAVFDEVSAEMYATASRVIDEVGGTPRDKARASLMALVLLTSDDPRKGRMLLREPLSESALIAAGMTGAPTMTRMLAQNFPGPGTGAERAMRAVAVGGAIATLFATMQLGNLHVTIEELVEFCVDLIAPLPDDA